MYRGRNRKRHHCNYVRIKTFKGETCVKFNPSIWGQYFPPKHDTIHLTEAGFTLISSNTIYTNPRVFGQLCSTLKLKEWTNTWCRWGNKKDLTGALIWSTFLLQKYTILIFMTINKKISILVFQYVSTYCTIIMI